MHDSHAAANGIYAGSPVDYTHSSANYYPAGEDGLYTVSDVAGIE